MAAVWGLGGWCALALAPAAGTARAGPCFPIGCPDLAVADEPGFAFPAAGGFVPDRRPTYFLNLYGGSCLYPPTGGPDWWHVLEDTDGDGIVDAVGELLERLDDQYDQGWRRFVLKLPAGAFGGYKMASSQWWPIPHAKRVALSVHLGAWIENHPDATVGIYGGFQVNDPCRLCMAGCAACSVCGEVGGCELCPECAGLPAAHAPDTTTADDMCIVYSNLQPWIDLGIYEIWFDAAGGVSIPQWTSMLRLAGNPDYQGQVRLAAEPLAVTGGSLPRFPVYGIVERIPFVSHRRYYEIQGGASGPAPWVFNPQTTEVHVIFTALDFCIDAQAGDGDPCTDCPDWCASPDSAPIDIVYEYVQRGYVPAAQWSRSARFLRRIYNLEPETVECPADLDADGDVDHMDVARVTANLGMFTGATLYHGDLDLDGDVDALDYLQVINALGTYCDYD